MVRFALTFVCAVTRWTSEQKVSSAQSSAAQCAAGQKAQHDQETDSPGLDHVQTP